MVEQNKIYIDRAVKLLARTYKILLWNHGSNTNNLTHD